MFDGYNEMKKGLTLETVFETCHLRVSTMDGIFRQQMQNIYPFKTNSTSTKDTPVLANKSSTKQNEQ